MENTRGQGRSERLNDSQECRNEQQSRNQQTSSSQSSESLDQQYVSSGRETGGRNQQPRSGQLGQESNVSSGREQGSRLNAGSIASPSRSSSDQSTKQGVTGSDFDGQINE
jgi:hypothetical protein